MNSSIKFWESLLQRLCLFKLLNIRHNELRHHKKSDVRIVMAEAFINRYGVYLSEQ